MDPSFFPWPSSPGLLPLVNRGKSDSLLEDENFINANFLACRNGLADLREAVTLR